MRYSVNDLPADEQEMVRRHVETCAECGEALSSLGREREALLQRMPSASLLASLERRRFAERRRARTLFGGSMTALLAAAALVLFMRTPSKPVGLKGGGLSIYVKRGQDVRPLGADERVRAGDALRLVLTLDRKSPVRIWSIDDQWRVDAIMPRARELGPGTIELDGSVVIENPCVSGWVVVSVGDSAYRTPDGQSRVQSLTMLSRGGFSQRLTCESR
jgi:hypothetical protein